MSKLVVDSEMFWEDLLVGYKVKGIEVFFFFFLVHIMIFYQMAHVLNEAG